MEQSQDSIGSYFTELQIESSRPSTQHSARRPNGNTRATQDKHMGDSEFIDRRPGGDGAHVHPSNGNAFHCSDPLPTSPDVSECEDVDVIGTVSASQRSHSPRRDGSGQQEGKPPPMQVPKDEKTWASNTRLRVSAAKALRQELMLQFKQPLGPRESPPDYQAISQMLQNRMTDWQDHSQQLLMRIEKASLMLQQLRVCIVHVYKEHESIQPPLVVCDTRLEIRARRPPEEALRDKLQEALEAEQSTYLSWQSRLAEGVNRGRDLMIGIEKGKADMARDLQGGRNALRADRTNLLYGCFHGTFTDTKRSPRRTAESQAAQDGSALIADAYGWESKASRYLNEYNDSYLRAVRRDVERAASRTVVALKKRLADLSQLKIHLEKEMAESGLAMSAAEQFLQHLRGILHDVDYAQAGEDEDGAVVEEKKAHTKWLLDERIRRQDGLVAQLQEAHSKMARDLKSKTEALVVDASCSKVRETLLRSTESDWQDGLPPSIPQEGSRNVASNRRQKRLPGNVLDKLRSKIKSAAYTGTRGRELDVLLRRWDKDGSGYLEENEVRAVLRRALKLPPTVISDQEISALCVELDADQSGSVSIGELVDFVGADPAVSQRSGKSLLPSMPKSPLNTTARLALNGDTTPRSESSTLTASLVPPMQRALRKRGPKLAPDVLERVRAKIKAASYTGHLGTELDVLFGRYDKDGTGQLDDAEVRLCVRRSLRIPPSAVSDAEITSLCSTLDADCSGTVSIDELVKFIGPASTVSKRTGKADVIATILSTR